MMYYSDEARESAIQKINDLIHKVARVSGNELSYTDSTEIIHYLSDYATQIKLEAKAIKK